MLNCLKSDCTVLYRGSNLELVVALLLLLSWFCATVYS